MLGLHPAIRRSIRNNAQRATSDFEGEARRLLIELAGLSGDGGETDSDGPRVDELVQELLGLGFDERTIAANVGRYLERLEWRRMVDEQPAKVEKAQQARKAYEEADVAEARRRRAALEELRAMEFEADRLGAQTVAAVACRDQLANSACQTDAEKQAEREVARLREEISGLEQRLSSDPPKAGGGYLAPTLDGSPGAYAAGLRRQIAEATRTNGATGELKKQLKAAEARVAEIKKAVAAKRRELASAEQRLRQAGAARFEPENFALDLPAGVTPELLQTS